MDLVEVHVVDSQAAERGVDGVEDVLTGESAVVGAVAHGEVDLGGDHHLLALGEVAKRSAEDLLADAA